MKTTYIIASFLVALGLLSGCEKKDPVPSDTTVTTVVEQPTAAPTPTPEVAPMESASSSADAVPTDAPAAETAPAQ